MALGVLGGTFDPIHTGHLIIAEMVREQFGLSQVLFLPAGRPWLKLREISPAADRVAMVKLAIADNSAFRFSPLEVERPGPSYAEESLAQFREELGVELFFIMGWDSLAQLPRWREPQRIISMARLVAVPRPGFPPPELAALEQAVPGLSARLHLLTEPVLSISSTLIRQRVARGFSIRYLVPAAVETYIRERGLYR